jgi:hypothetical protein
MRMKRLWLGVGAAILLLSGASCANILHSGIPDMTTDSAPPESWQAGVVFSLSDSAIHYPNGNFQTRVEFSNKSRRRVVTNRDLFEDRGGAVRTPWYRLWPGEDQVALHVTITHPGGAQTVAEYPLFVQTDGFYTVAVGVYTRTPPANPAADGTTNLMSYRLNPAARASVGDSLWISSGSIPRVCFRSAVCN